jgi:hypothetical protein
MKSLLSLLVLILSIGIILNGCDDIVFWWDSDETKKAKEAKWKAEKKKDQEKFMENLRPFLLFTDGETISLLSYKYSVDEKTLIDLIQEYYEYSIKFKIEQTTWLSENLGDDTLQEHMNLRPQFKVLDSISEKYNIPKDKLAALLIDYKILSQDGE